MASVKLIDRGVAFWKRSPLTRRLVRGNLWALGGAGSARALGLLASIFVARVLGKVHFGEFGMIQSTVGLLGTVAGVGLGSTATKYVAEHRTTDRALTGRIIALSSLVSWLAGGAMTVLLLLLAPWLAVHSLSAPQLAPQLRVGALLLFFGGINGAQTGSLYGFEAFKAVAHINVWVGLLTFPCLVVGVHYGGLIGAVWGLVANLIIGCAANYVCLQGLLRRNDIQIQWRGCLSEIPIVWKFSLPVILQSLTITPAAWLSSTFLAATPGGYAALGSFSVGTQWRNAILFVPWIFGNTALPALSNLHGEKNARGYRRAIYFNILMIGGAAGAVTLGIVLFAPLIVASYGSGFADSVSVVRLMALCGFLWAINVVPSVSLTSSGRVWTSFFLTLPFSIILIGLAYAFVGPMGAIGLALAHTIAYAVYTAWQGTLLYRQIRTTNHASDALTP
jgi:O-antigen/teichoic acid export membrane protein